MSDPKTGSAPHDCPNCGSPAYIGGPGFPAQCTSRPCPFYSEDCWVRWVMELPDDGDPLEIDEDAKTSPGLGVPTTSQWIKLTNAAKNLGPPPRYAATPDEDTGISIADYLFGIDEA